jgi:hypothetical protein
LVDGRHKHVDSHEESGIANADRKTATEAQPIAVAHFSMQTAPVGPTLGTDSQCEPSARNPSAVAADALPETRTGERTALLPPSRTNVLIGMDAGVSSGTANESATRMTENDEFVAAAWKAGPDHGASNLIDSRSAPGTAENRAIPTGNGVPAADLPRVVPPAFSGLSNAQVMQSAQWSGHSAASKDAPGQPSNSRTIRTATRGAASAGSASEKGSSSIAAQGGMSPVQLREAEASNGSGEQSAASATGSTRGPVNDANGRVVEDPFAVIDADRSSGATTWIHAGPRHAEAGYLDPSLGWVGVRADVSASGIHAAVVPGSAEAAQALGGHISGLSAYITEHHGQTATVTLASPQYRNDGTGTGPQAGFGGAGTERHSADSDREGPRSAGAVEPPRERSVSSGEPIPGTITIGQQGSARAGRYVSVVA